MPDRQHLIAFAVGIVSACIFLLVYGIGSPIPLLLTPTLPLLMLGLAKGVWPVLLASGAGTLFVLIFTKGSGALFYLGFLAVPAVLFAPVVLESGRIILLKKEKDAAPTKIQEYSSFTPVGLVLTDVSIYLALAFAGVIAYFTGDGGLQSMLDEHMNASFSQMDPSTQMDAERLVHQWSFLIFAVSGWWWVFLLYMHGVFANWLLKKQGLALRQHLPLGDFRLPPLLLLAVAGLGLMTFSDNSTLAMLAKTGALILLLPYFLLGLTQMRRYTENLPGGGMLLFFIYFWMFILLWPVLIVVAIGLGAQCREIKETGLWR